MTQTLTTERLKQIASGDAFICTQDDESVAMARELLANRESPPVGYAENGKGFIYQPEHRDRIKNPVAVFTAPPAPIPVNFSENADADMCRKWAWEQVKELVSTDGWTLGDNITYFGFFCWGWDMRRQYNEQRPPAPVVNPEFTGATAVPTFEEWLLTQENKPLGWVRDSMKESYDACRAAMLDQPVSQRYKLPDGWKLVPIEATPEILQAGITAHCDRQKYQRPEDAKFVGPMESAYNAMLAAAPEGGNG